MEDQVPKLLLLLSKMEDQVPFKVYTFWKENSKPEVRRFGVEKSVVPPTFHYLNAKLQEAFPGLKNKSYTVSWKDEDEDDIIISSDEEVLTALGTMKGEVVKLYVHNIKDTSDSKDNDVEILLNIPLDEGYAPTAHPGVVCDSCDQPVVGFRYKCASCFDYDLCAKCEAAGLHPEHCMVRIPQPTMPRALIKSAIKRSRHFLKGVSEDSHKRHKHDKSGDKKHVSQHRESCHGRESFRENDHGRCPRNSWLATFTGYINEFANLAGDVGLNDHPADHPTNQRNQQTSNEVPKPGSSTSKETQCPFPPGGLNVEKIQKFLELYLGEQAFPSSSQTPSVNNAAEKNSNNAAEKNSNNAAEKNTNTDVEMGQGDTKTSDGGADKVTVKSEASFSTDNRDQSPDKADNDWTMINKDKDLQDTYVKPEAPADHTPIDLNLSQEFQERVTISEGQSLYPALNPTTAVLNPKEKTPQKAAQVQAEPTPVQPTPSQASQTQGQTNQQKTDQPQPGTRYHADPHIDAAIYAMLSMGFTNEDGWLTQLLESKQGNIAAVLDLLTPVNPRK